MGRGSYAARAPAGGGCRVSAGAQRLQRGGACSIEPCHRRDQRLESLRDRLPGRARELPAAQLQQGSREHTMSSNAASFIKLTMAALAVTGLAHSASAPTTSATPLTTRPLIGIPGKEGVMLTVEFPPGASSPPHRHNANTFVYVLEGSVVMQVAGGKEVTLRPGETFYE